MNKKSMLPWHQPLWNDIFNRCAKHYLPHAILLTGQQGMGKKYFAQQLAKKLLCLETDSVSLACEECRSCLLFESKTHPDYFLLEPDEKSQIIKVDSIRALVEKVVKTPQISQRQVVILNAAETMNLSAANAFLKTLEDPPGDTVILLVSHAPDQLPITIRSRCQTWFFALPEHGVATTWLQSQLSNKKDVTLLLKIAEGAPLRALALAEEGVLAERHEFLSDIAALMSKKVEPIALAGKWHKNFSLVLFHYLDAWLSDLIRLQFSLEKPFVMNSDFWDVLSALSEKFSIDVLYTLKQKVQDNVRSMYNNINLNKQLLLEDVFIFLGRAQQAAFFVRTL